MSGERPHMPDSEFTSPHLFSMPPGMEGDEIDFTTQFNNNAAITNEGAGKLTGLLSYLAEFNDTISINDGRGRRVRVLGVEDVAGSSLADFDEWWAMTPEVVEGELIIHINEGMCIYPDKFYSGTSYDANNPNPPPTQPGPHAWKHNNEGAETGIGAQSHKISSGITKFYVKAYCEEVETKVSNKVTTHNYNFQAFEIEVVQGETQPDDTATQKYQLLGVLVTSDEEESDGAADGGDGEGGGHCPELDMKRSYWRTGHVFNWTYYTCVSGTDVKESDKHLNLNVYTKYYKVLNYNGSTSGNGDKMAGSGANIMTYDGEEFSPEKQFWRFGLYMGNKDPGMPKDKDGNPLLDAAGKVIEPIMQDVDIWKVRKKSPGGSEPTPPNINTIKLAVCKSGVPKEVTFVIMK